MQQYQPNSNGTEPSKRSQKKQQRLARVAAAHDALKTNPEVQTPEENSGVGFLAIALNKTTGRVELTSANMNIHEILMVVNLLRTNVDNSLVGLLNTNGSREQVTPSNT